MRILYNFQKLINKPEEFTKEKRARLEELHRRFLPKHYHSYGGALQWAIVYDDSVDAHCWWYNETDAEGGTRNYKEYDYDSEFTFDNSKIIIMSLF